MSKGVEAVIFDMDGVISDTQKIHSHVESLLLFKHGIHLSSDEITKRFSGVQTSKFFKELFDEHKIEVDVSELMMIKWRTMLGTPRKNIKEIPGATKLIADLRRNELPLAVASASIKGFINFVLYNLKVLGAFKEVVSAYDDRVKKGKPEPDIFLLAAKRLGVDPEKSLVIEDGISGMIGAKKAGMKCIGLVPNRSWSTPADFNVESLSEITPELIQSM